MTNALAYYENQIFTDRKSFKTLAPGLIVIELISSRLMVCQNKLECVSLAIFFQASLIIASNAVAYRVEKLMVLQSKGRLIAFPTNVRLKTRPVPKSET